MSEYFESLSLRRKSAFSYWEKQILFGAYAHYNLENTTVIHVSFDILRFTDDTIIMDEGCWSNLWCIKTVLRGFELVSGFKVNFFKSKLYGVNLKRGFMHTSSVLLNWCVDILPFKFLGMLVGASHRRMYSWKYVIDNVKKRLSTWKGRGVDGSKGGHHKCGFEFYFVLHAFFLQISDEGA